MMTGARRIVICYFCSNFFIRKIKSCGTTRFTIKTQQLYKRLKSIIKMLKDTFTAKNTAISPNCGNCALPQNSTPCKLDEMTIFFGADFVCEKEINQ